MKPLAEQTHYEVLELIPGCTAALVDEAVVRARELYGPGSLAPYALAEPAEAAALLRRMELERVTALEGDRFSRRDLSAGQRKRLALIAALLERKPILILDEWAADQDPQFRGKFYRELLPELKRRGLTVIAVTHDDAYFDAADRRLHMEEGRMTELAAGRGA